MCLSTGWRGSTPDGGTPSPPPTARTGPFCWNSLPYGSVHKRSVFLYIISIIIAYRGKLKWVHFFTPKSLAIVFTCSATEYLFSHIFCSLWAVPSVCEKTSCIQSAAGKIIAIRRKKQWPHPKLRTEHFVRINLLNRLLIWNKYYVHRFIRLFDRKYIIHVSMNEANWRFLTCIICRFMQIFNAYLSSNIERDIIPSICVIKWNSIEK